ncbi:MAG: molybdopterin-dependent oxidoreductase [Eggerthellaceae bacterium]|nr:molybdopterin-dependent oxidoreductase [Eggerthellaceae bacterium]
MSEIKPTNCHFCGYCCAFLATVEDGRVVDLRPDPSRYPYDEKILAGCRRWRMNLDVLDSPRRVNYPLRRVGERGMGEWERVTWDDALDDIAVRLDELRTQYNSGVLASAIGGPHASFWPLHRFMSLFGSPNNMGIGNICWNPRIWMDAITFGWTIEADIRFDLTGALFIWGTNPAQSDNSAFWQAIRAVGKSDDMALVCIDPRYTQIAALADLWLPIRPGTDCTLALGLIHVIVRDGLVDQAFVDEWCHGFDELVEHVKPFTPDYVGDFCGVPADDVVQAAYLFANGRPTALVSGRGIDQVGESVAPTHRAICCLRAITGNVDRPGSCVLAEASDFTSEVEFEMSDALTPDQRALCLNRGIAPLQTFEGYDLVRAQTEKFGRRLPMRYMTSVVPDRILHAMETGEPYPIRALIVNATNPLLTYADTNRVYQALKSLDLLVVLDYYITPTAAIADYVLPVAGAIERPIFQIHGGVANNGYGGPAAVEPYYERKTDYDIFKALGQRLGQGEHWPYDSLTEAFAAQLAPTGMSWEKYCRLGMYFKQPPYEKHLLPGLDGKPQGFATSTGKIELASELLPQLGGQRLPEQGAFASFCSEELVRAAEARGAAHLPMITGSRKQPYNASMYMDNPKFRKGSPRPVAELSAATAARLGLQAGDTLRLSTDFGEARFTLAIAKMRDDLISVDYGWWHPEWQPTLPDLGGIWESNVNCLTSCTPREPLIGTWAYNAVDCIVEKCNDVLSWDSVPFPPAEVAGTDTMR